MARTLLDIETAPLENAADFIDFSDIKAPANYKDPAKIEAYIEEAKARALDNCSLDPDLCRVVVLGCWRDDWAEPVVDMATDDEAECAMLSRFWHWVNGSDLLITYNGVAFDVPVLMRRSLYLGVSAPALDVGKYRHGRIEDLMLRLSFDGALKYRSQDWYLRRFGYVEPDPTPDISGAEVAQHVAAGDLEPVREHCRRDMYRLRFLAERLGVLAVEEVF
jgi:hypothetical protein